MELNNKIRELRKSRGLTQEQLASALGVSPQAVSKWEMKAGYPDMSMIPMLANFFDVSLDTLFDFDVTKKAKKIEDILEEAGKYFWEDFNKAEEIYKAGISEYPSSDKLKAKLLELYESHMSCYGKTELSSKAVPIAHKIIAESTDIFAVCSAKNSLATIYTMENKYDEAKAIIDTLPVMYPAMLNDRMRCSSYILKGNDRLKWAGEWKVMEEQELFIACALEADGYFETGDYNRALNSYTESRDIIERFMIPGKTGAAAYHIFGTHSNHMYTLLGMAGCFFALGRTEKIDAL
ncbi:MAG: helix-turn-helix domain-containing protein, partial [Eubacteriales bacterium]